MESSWISHPTILTGQITKLVPLEEELFEELYLAASDKRIWEFYPGDWSKKERFLTIYKKTLSNRELGIEYPFVIYHMPTKRIIGSTRLLDIVTYDRRLEIGGTWMMPEYWSTAVNFDCKLALLCFCFEKLHTKRVLLKTQHNNIRSWKAIEKIGGQFEGIIRQHMLKDDGSFRDSAFFSILDTEWENVKMKIQILLEQKIINSNLI